MSVGKYKKLMNDKILIKSQSIRKLKKKWANFLLTIK